MEVVSRHQDMCSLSIFAKKEREKRDEHDKSVSSGFGEYGRCGVLSRKLSGLLEDCRGRFVNFPHLPTKNVVRYGAPESTVREDPKRT
jgi:hypothetical protein